MKPYKVYQREDGKWIISFEAGGYPYFASTLAKDYPYEQKLCVHYADMLDRSIYVDAEVVNNAVKEYLQKKEMELEDIEDMEYQDLEQTLTFAEAITKLDKYVKEVKKEIKKQNEEDYKEIERLEEDDE